MLGPLFAIFGQKIGGNILDISWAWALYLITLGIFIIVVGKISDKIGKEKLLVIGYGLNAIFTFSYLLVSNPYKLFAVQFGLGIAAALATPTWSSLYAKYEDKKHDGAAWGLVTGTDRIITGLALMTGGFIITYYSFNVLFVIMGCIQIVATISQAFILKKNDK
jgi:MFS family permease